MTPALIALTVVTTLGVAIAMEGWAALLHGAVWHRALWFLHESHHRRRTGRFEANDLLSALHAPIAIAIVVHGCRAAPSVARALTLGVGFGMTLFGVAYFVCHDGFVHRRLPVGLFARIGYFDRVARAHRAHHVLGRAPFGFFAAPLALKLGAHSRILARRAIPSAKGLARESTGAPPRRRTAAASRPPAESA